MTLTVNIDAPQPPMVAAPAPNRSAGAVAAFAIGLLAILWVYRDAWLSMERVWRGSDTFGHGYLVPPISLWLAWRLRDSLRGVPVALGWLGLPALALAYLAWLAGELGGVNSVSQLAVVGMIGSWTLLSLGHRVAWRLSFPLAFLVFAVPLGEGLEPVLMQWTADATVASLRLVGVPVYREGLHFMLPSGSWSVVEACSGLRYLIAALMLAVLFAHLNYRSWRRRALFVSAALGLALVANWVRAWLVVMLGHLSDMRLGAGEDHVWYGWAFFGLVMLAVFRLGSRWRDPERETAPGQRVPAKAPGTETAAWPFGGIAAALAVAAGLGLAHSLPDRLARTVPRADYATVVAKAVGGEPLSRLSLEPSYAHPLAQVRGVVASPGPVEFYSAYFADQRARSEMIAFGNHVLGSRDPLWSIVSTSAVAVRAPRGATFTATEYVVRSGTRKALVWHWYVVAGRSMSSPYAVKLATLEAIVRRHGDHSSVNVLYTALDDGEINARERLASAAGGLAAAAAAATLP